MKMKNITKCLAASVVFGILSLATQRAHAELEMSYTGDSTYLLGTVIPPDTTGNGQVTEAVNQTNNLLAMSNAMNNQQTLNGSLYSRTTLAGSDAAVPTGNVINPGAILDGTTAVSITLPGTFHYLVVHYDGPTFGAVAVFNITGLTGTINLYRYAKIEVDGMGNPTGNLIGSNSAGSGFKLMSSWTLLNPYTVPDGGATVMLLGTALGALGMARRYFKR